MREKQAEKGTVIVFIALMLPFLILFAGMAIDIGRGYLHKSDMQNAADAASLAGVEKVSSSQARLIAVSDVPTLGQFIQSESSRIADAGADKFLTLDNKGTWQTGGSNVKTELRKKVDPSQNNPIRKRWSATYYYKVELTDNMDFQFARMFLPEALIPADWKVNVESWAESSNLSGIDLLTQGLMVEEAETFSTYQELEKGIRKPSNVTTDKSRYVKDISFTNAGPTYNATDGTRSEVFNMDGTNELNNNMKNLFINFKPDFSHSQKLTDNWDLDAILGMSVTQARQYLYNLVNKGVQLTNWRIIDEQGNLRVEHEGGPPSLWGAFYDNLKKVYGISESMAEQLMFARIASIINIVQPYEVRDVESLAQTSPKDISYSVYDDTPNKYDPLFVRIESEEYNESNGKAEGPYVTNTVRDISINIKADNTEKDMYGDYKYRPMLFFYDGPVGENNERGVGRKSRTVNFTLEEDFRGILFAPNSPVHVEGNGHKFYGIIVAEKIVDAAGNIIPMPDQQNKDTDAELQSFYSQLGFEDATYDDFEAVQLTVYKNPKKDVVYLTPRAGNTT